MYYLCRPLIKLTYMGAPPLPGEIPDPRNIVSTSVGPFLTLNGSNYSRGRPSDDNTEETFDPGFVWTGNASSRAANFWDTRGMKLCEIIDGYGRPLCYDKVKTNTPKYFQPDRFHKAVTGSSTTSGSGTYAHSDVEYMESEMPVFDDDENACPTGDVSHGAPATLAGSQRYLFHQDPRFIATARAADGCNPQSASSGGTVSTHAPKNVGGYDLWSPGKSFTNTNDDITSWGE